VVVADRPTPRVKLPIIRPVALLNLPWTALIPALTPAVPLNLLALRSQLKIVLPFAKRPSGHQPLRLSSPKI
jgi:hypothetical protein